MRGRGGRREGGGEKGGGGGGAEDYIAFTMWRLTYRRAKYRPCGRSCDWNTRIVSCCLENGSA